MYAKGISICQLMVNLMWDNFPYSFIQKSYQNFTLNLNGAKVPEKMNIFQVCEL